MAPSTLLGPFGTWARRNLVWSNSRQSWAERSAAVALVTATGAAAWFGPALTPAAQTAVWIALVLAFALLLRRGWVKLFGPVFFYDLVRTARRRPFLLVRFLYVASLAGLFFLVAENMIHGMVNDLGGVLSVYTAELHPRQVAELAEAFSFIFLGLQIFTAFLLTPVMVAGAIAEQRQRRTLEFLLATDLRSREIVLGTLASRLAGLLLILLGGMPILFLMEFLGGVDPHLLLAGFVATGLSVVSLGCLSILNSVVTRRPLRAIALTYLEVFAYLVLSFAFKRVLPLAGQFLMLLATLYDPDAALKPVPDVANFPSMPGWTSPVTVQDLANWLDTGNIGSATVELAMALNGGTPLDMVLPGLLEGYAWFHVLFAAVCLIAAVARLRPVALKFAEGPVKRRRAAPDRPRLPLVGRWPVLWKELFAAGRLRRRERIAVLFVAVLSLFPALAVLAVYTFLYPFESWDGLAEFLNGWVRVLGTFLACFMLLLVAMRAAGSVGGERDRQTLDMLLTTPLSSRAILGGKWFGAVLGPRRGWAWLAAVWGLAYFGGGLEGWQLPCLFFAELVYAALFASLGLWFSVRSRSTTRAVLGFLLVMVAAPVGLLVLVSLWSDEKDATYVFELLPPAVLDQITTGDFDSRPWGLDRSVQIALELILTAVLAALLWVLAVAYFRRTNNRAAVQWPAGMKHIPIADLGAPEVSAACLSESTGG